MIRSLLAIALGASIGASCRWGLGVWLNSAFPTIPPGTLVANLIGGYIIGLAFVFFGANPGLSPEWRLLVITGFLGALTTFSSFSLEVSTLIQQGRLIWAMGAISVHVIGSLLMTFLGMGTMTFIMRSA